MENKRSLIKFSDLCRNYPQRLAGFPLAPGKVRKLDWGAVRGDGFFAQSYDSAYGGPLVHIRIRGFALPQALDEPIIFDKIHPAVASPLCFFLQRYQKRMLVLLTVKCVVIAFSDVIGRNIIPLRAIRL